MPQGGGAAPLVPRRSWEPKDYAARPVDAGAASPSPSYWPSAAGAPSPAAALPFAPDDAPSGFFSSRVYRGQVWEMYLVFEGPLTVVFVDQHAAHERIAFHKIM